MITGIKSLLTILSATVFLTGQSTEGADYPVPQRNSKLLFYVQRTHNSNTVIYELNRDNTGKINPDEPLHASWIRYQEGGIRQELSFIQKKVYGLEVTNNLKDGWVLKFRQYRKRDIFLMPVPGKDQYRAMININGKMAELVSLYISTVTNALGIPSTVKYIDLKGIDPATGLQVTERIIPE